MLDDEPGKPPGTDPGTRGQDAERDDTVTVAIDARADDGSDRAGGDGSFISVGLDRGDVPDSTGRDSFGIGVGDVIAGDDEHELPAGDADAHEPGFGASSGDFGELDVDLSPWAPLLGMLDSTEREASPGELPFSPVEGAERAHALELRAESMLHYAERGALRTGTLDRTEVGDSDDNRDVVAGRDAVEVDGMLDEHTGHGLVVVADDVEVNVGGPLTMHAHLEDNIIMAGVMRDEFAGGTLVTAAMSDDMAAGLGLRCTAPLDVWAHGLVGMEERPGTCAADGLLLELAGTLYEREYGPSAHVAAVARFQGTVATTMKTGFRPLMKVALGVRNLIPGGSGGGGSADASPPAAPPAAGDGEAAGATLTAAEGGGAIGRGAGGGDDTDEIVSVVRNVESASDAADVEDLQHPASTADNLDDLARVDAEGMGPHQVAEIYEQPVPVSAASEPDAGPGSGSDSAAQASGYKKAPELDLTEPGTEGYDFQKSYGTLRDQVEHYRADSNWRGNMITRDYLQGIDAKATELFEGLGGNPAALAGDNRGYKTSNIYAAMEQMAREAEAAEDLDQLTRIRNAMAELEEFTQGELVAVAARTDEIAGTALGSQRMPIDPNIDTDKLRAWLQKRCQEAQDMYLAPTTPAADQPAWSWTAGYYDQMIKTLDAGINPLAESSEQIAFIQITKVDKHHATWPVEHADEIAEAAADGYILTPPRLEAEDQLDIFRPLHDGLLDKLSDPAFQRSAAEMGNDVYTPFVGARIEADDAFLGPTSLRSPPRREPPPLDLVAPGTEGYDFRRAYGSLDGRNRFYRDDFNFRGNFFVREHLHEIDAQAFDLFTDLGGAADAIEGDNFGNRTSSIYRHLQEMATQADEAGEVGRAGDIRAAISRIEEIVNDNLAQVAARTDEFSGAAVGSQRAPIDPNIDKVRLRGWLQGQLDETFVKFDAATTPEGNWFATWEEGYYRLMIQALDNGVNPLAVSNEQIAVLRINQVEPYYAQFAEEIAAATAQGYELVIPRPRVEDQVDLYGELQKLLTYMLSNPEYHRSAEVMGDNAFTPTVRARIHTGFDDLVPDLRPPLVAGSGDVALPLPAVDFADGVIYVGEVRDRSFARSALAASEEALERQAAGLAQGNASVRSSAPVPDIAPPESSFGTHRASPDDARAPVIDEQSGRWIVEPSAEPGASPAPGTSTTAHRDAVSPPASEISWESGLQVSGDSGVDPAAGGAGDADTSNLFKAASEPEDVDPDAVDELQHAPAPDDDGTSGSPTTLSDGSGGEDANPTGTVSDPDDPTTSGLSDGAEPGRSGTTSSVTPDTPDPVSTGAPGNPPGTDATPAGATAADADAGAAGTRSDLYTEPVSFEGRSLEGASRSDNPKELARSLESAEIPVDDLPRVEPDRAGPGRRSVPENSDGGPVSDTYADLDESEIQRRLAQAGYNKRVFNDSTVDAGSVWRDTMWSGDRREVAALREANSRWSEFTAAQRTSTVSFSDDPRQLLYHVEYERTVRTQGSNVDLFRGVDPPNTVDRAHAAHYIPRPGGWESTRETGFGRLAQGWNEFPFSHREQIVNALSRGESLSPDQVAALGSGLEGYRAAGGELSSSQYRAMVDMIADLGDQYRHTRWSVQGEGGERLLQLVEMLDHAAGSA